MSNYNILLATDINYLPYSFVTCQSVLDSLSNHNATMEASYRAFNEANSNDKIIFHIVVDETVNTEELTIVNEINN